MGNFVMTHVHTPLVNAMDSRRLGVRGVAYHRRDTLSVAEPYITEQLHDAAGRAVLSRDPRLFRLQQTGLTAVNQRNVVSLSGAVLLSENSDAGWRLGLLNEAGQTLEAWDQQLNHSRLRHDRQRRPVAAFESVQGGAERCIARFTYGDANAAVAHNLCGRLTRQDDSAGAQQVTDYGVAGTALTSSRTFVADPHWPIDWPESEAARNAHLENDPAITHVLCNAAGEPISQTDAFGNRQAFFQTRAGQLHEVRLSLSGQVDETTLVSDIRYNAVGQVERQRAANGVICCATFGLDDGRLQRLSAGLAGQPPLQDLVYDYDATGNVTRLTDGAQVTRHHRNQRIEPINRYRYDSLYRLVEASGWQVRNAAGGPQLPPFQCPPDPGQLENYTRSYTYDAAGNLLLMRHQADSSARTERTAVARLSNRSLPEMANGEMPDEQHIAAGYDLNGNRKHLQPGQDLLWNGRNQLRQVDQVVREDEPNDCEFYVYDGSGQRQRKIRQACTGTLTHTHETRYLPGIETRTSAAQTLHVITIKAGRGTVQVLHWVQGSPPGMAQDQYRYSLTDHLGSSTLELDEAAGLITWEHYYPYGVTCWWAGRNTLQARYKTMRYSGQERDATGLYYYGLRYYVPWCQRWLNADPAGTADGLNLYAMVRGNPVGYIDSQGLNRVAAVTTGATVDGLAAFFGATTRMIVSASLSQLPPTDTSNNLLLVTAVALESSSSAYAAAGLGANSRHSVVPFVMGISAGVLAAIPAFHNRTDLDENQLNTDAIDRIATVAGNFVRESIQVAGNQQGGNYAWGDTGLISRLRSVGPTAILYGGLRAVSSYLQAGMAAPIRGFLGFIAEAADGGIGALLRSMHPNTAYQAGSGQITFDRQYAHNVMHGGFGRNVSALINREVTRLLRPLVSTLPEDIQSTILGAIGFWTEGRGVVMAAVKRGYDSHPVGPASGPELGDAISETPEPARRRASNRALPI
jgi:insecticidal toxin complex protein TccC